MPELPEVELFKRHLDATCLGRSIRRVVINDTRILAGLSASELAQRLEGARIIEFDGTVSTFWSISDLRAG